MTKEYEKKVSAGKAKVITIDFADGGPGYESVTKLKATYSASAVREIINDLVSRFLSESK